MSVDSGSSTDVVATHRISPIPLLIHQVWIDKRGPTYSYPSRYNIHRSTLKLHNPDMTMRMWLGSDVMDLFDVPELSKYRAMYDRLPHPVMKADVARIMILYHVGGVYLDLDFVGFRPLSGLLEKYPTPILLSTEPSGCAWTYRTCNNFLASSPKHPLWLGFLDWIECRNSGCNDCAVLSVTSKTGPVALYDYLSGLSIKDSNGPYADWKRWLVPNRYVLPLLPNGKISREAKPYWNPVGSLYDQKPADITGDGPYVASIWTDGTEWVADTRRSCAIEMLKWYAAIVIAGIFIVLVVFGWGRRYKL